MRAALLGSVALILSGPVQAAGTAEIEALENQMRVLMQELQDMKTKQGRQDREIDLQRQEIEAQEQRIEEQRKQIEAQGEAEEATPAPAQAVTGGAHPGSFKLPGTDTSMKIGGYVKADLWYDIQADTGNSFNTTSIPEDGTDDEKGSFRAQARQSRLNFTSWTPTPVGEVKTFVEGDFLGAGGNEKFSNSTSFRLRHAFGQLRAESFDLIFGQTWTNFMPLDSYPDTVDFFGPTGIPFIRQGQARFTYNGVENFKIAFSVENSELTGRDGAGQSVGSENGDVQFGIDTLPDFIGSVEYRNDGWFLKFSGLARLLEVDGTSEADKEFAYGLFAGAVIPTFGDDSFQLNATYGDGVGRYLINGDQQDAFIEANGDLDTIKQWGVAAAYTHHWSSTWRTNLVYGHNEFVDTFARDDTESLDTVHVNLMWKPSPAMQFGIEYIYGQRGFQDADRDNSANRVQFGAQYFF